MKPEPNQKITILFRNGLKEDGVVISWSEKRAALRHPKTDNVLIIQDTEQDVMAIMIHNEEPQSKPNEFIEKLNEMGEPELTEREHHLRIKELSELRMMKKEHEERLIKEHFKKQANPENTGAQYGLPAKLQKPIDFYLRKKDRT